MADERPLPALESDGARQLAPATMAVVADARDASTIIREKASEQAKPGVGRNGLPPPVASRWQKGICQNPGGLPKSKKFVSLLRAFFANPDTMKLIHEKMIRDLKGNGPATFTIQMAAYAFGAPKQVLEVEVREKMRDLANEAGVSPDAVLATAERLLEAGPN